MDVDDNEVEVKGHDEAPGAKREKPRKMIEQLRQSLVEQPGDEMGKRRLSNAESTR
jgi:hypothetical protein